MSSRFPWHPVLLAGCFVAFNVVDTGVHIAAAGRAIFVALAGAVLLQLLVSAVLKSRHRGAAIATLAIAIVMLWVPLREIAAAMTRLPTLQAWLIITGAVAVVAYGLRTVSRHPLSIPIEALTRALNGLTAALAIVIAVSTLLSPTASALARDAGLDGPTPARGVDDEMGTRDILLFLVDGHPRPDSVLEQTGHDISGFIDSLEALGFVQAPDARSNHDWTGATLTSLLDMRPASEVSDNVAAGHAGSLEIRTLLRQPAAFEVVLVRSHGYKVVAIGPPYEHVALRGADHFIDAGYLNSFECHLVRRTALGSAMWALALADDETPRFVLIHLPVPHIPLLWDDRGKPVDEPYGSDCHPQEATGLGPSELRAAYLESLDWADELVRRIMTDIAARDESERPVVILFSDHGGRLVGPSPDHNLPTHRRDSFGILFAALTPGEEDVFPGDVSLVNVLPRLFNTYLGTDLELNPDNSFSTDGAPAPEP